MHYLTLQDIIWLNLQLTKSTGEYDSEPLEEATFYQYALGDSQGVAAQAARFLIGFRKMSPFAEGNEACAFIGMAAFIEANGQAFDLSDDKGAEWMQGVWERPEIAADAIKAKLREAETEVKYGVPDMLEICGRLIKRYKGTVSALVKPETAPEPS
ncbi:MAG: hypothetical protein IIC73_08230 [Armatimonadetes bacterium]|nr:hypothetical protein [Armatimonadota bacterium]